MIKKLFSVFLLGLVINSSVLVPKTIAANSVYYANFSNIIVHRPVATKIIPIGATAQCKDNTYSFSKTRRGTCSHHGGVKKWLK